MLNSVPYVTVDFGKTAERVRFDIAHGMGIVRRESFDAEAPCSGHGADSRFSVADFGCETLFQGFRNGYGSPGL